MKYEFIEHTADVFIQAYGKNIREAIENLAEGLFALMVDNYKEIKCKFERKIKVEGEDIKSLIFDFLTEILVLHDSENLVFKNVDVEKLENNKIEAVVCGDYYDPEIYKEHVAVKAITYHEMEIKESEEGVKIKVLVDI